MAKIKVRKDVAEQMTSKLKTPKKGLESANSVKNLTNFDNTSKLQANENISKGIIFIYDSDDILIKSINWSNRQPVKVLCSDGITRTYYKRIVTDEDKAFIHARELFDNIAANQTNEEKEEIQNIKRKCKNPFITKEGYLFYYEGNRYSKDYLNKLKNSGNKFLIKQYNSILLEIKHISVLANNGFKIYLPKEADNDKSFDAIINNIKVDFKYIQPNTKIDRIREDISDGLKQADNVSIFIDKNSKLNKEDVIKEGRQEVNITNKPVNIVDIYFEKDNDIKIIDARKKISSLKKGAIAVHTDISSFVDYASLDSLTKSYDSLSRRSLANKNSQKKDGINTVSISKDILAHCDNLSSKNVTKSLFTDWKVELHHLCDKKGLDYDSIIQKYDDKLTRYVAEEQLHQDAENVIAYKAYKDLNKSLTYSGHKLQGRTKLYGMDISIENKKGSYRSGVDKDGHKWKTLMHYDYGYIRGTVGTDKDHLDCYVGSDKEAQKVYVIHQNDPVTHKYDEDKCMLCFSSAADAKAAYMKQYDRPGFYGSMTTMTIEQFKSFIFSHKGKMVHKSFDINITDITENNKQQKFEQVNKALNAIADNRPFMIKHIPADSSTNYGNLLVRITDFDRSKIEKAVHKIALSLDADISGASKGETFVYKAQEELVDKYFKEFTNRTRAIYNFVIGYFDLPDIRIVSKAGELRHKGKILYNPSTGLPIKESEWKKFVVELEKYLNRNYIGIGEKIVLSAESLGIILDRLSKTNSLDEIRKMSVADLKAKRYDVDWIGDSIKNMKDKFGDVISRERQARIQIAMDSAAQRVTRVKDDMRNNIQQIIIDGIRDKQSKSVVAQNLFDKCASLNRDMQRIADSEVQMAANSAYIQEEVYNSEPGSKVYFKRFEMMDDNTCKKCRKLNGTIVLWSDVPLPEERIKDPYAKYAIWDGKNDGACPVGIVHPWCRGSWIRYYPEV